MLIELLTEHGAGTLITGVTGPHMARDLAGADLRHVDTWLFDLDNTLYPPDSNLWPLIDARITAFMIDLFGLDTCPAAGAGGTGTCSMCSAPTPCSRAASIVPDGCTAGLTAACVAPARRWSGVAVHSP